MTKQIGIALAAYQPQLSAFAEQLKSIQEQSWKDWVCVITCDSPIEPILKDSRMLPFREDRRFVWIENHSRLGHKKNFEKAIQAVLSHSVDAIACSDQDDIWYPEKLAVLAETLNRVGPLSLVHCDMHVLRNGKIEPLTAWQVERRGVENAKPEHLMIRNVVAGCAMLFDAELARKYPIIPEGVEYHDHWYALVASFYGGVHAVSRPLYAYRQHGQNEVGVSPFEGVLMLPKGVEPRELLRKFVTSWEKTRMLAKSVQDAGLTLTSWQKLLYLKRRDFGLGFLYAGIGHLNHDPALARAYFKRAIGKALQLS